MEEVVGVWGFCRWLRASSSSSWTVMSEEKMSFRLALMLGRKRSCMLVRLKALGQWRISSSPSRATTVVSSNQVLIVVSDSSSRRRSRIIAQMSETDCIEALPFFFLSVPLLFSLGGRSPPGGESISRLLYQKMDGIATDTYSNIKKNFFCGPAGRSAFFFFLR